MRILAIESSCDETAAAVLQDGRTILSSVVLSQVDEHKKYGGVVPEIASRRHIESISQVVTDALSQASVCVDELDGIAVTAGPGLIGALLVGVNFAKSLAYANRLPLIPVHHIRGHVASNYLEHQELKPPFIALIVSGGHSHIVEVLDYTDYRIVGHTVDDAAGEAFDKVARTIGFDYPGGVYIDKAAQQGNPTAYKLPFPKVEGKYNFSFSGIKTAVINLIHNAEQKNEIIDPNDLSASFQHTVCEILTDKFISAAKDLGHKTLVVAGGVAANSGLRSALKQSAEKNNLRLYFPSIALCGDNAAMIGAQGYYEFLAGNLAKNDLNAYAGVNIENPEKVFTQSNNSLFINK